jgi:hypothetical protein
MEPLCSHYLARKNERHPERRLPESKDRSDPLDLILRDGFPGTIVRCLHSPGELLLVEPTGAKSPSQAWRYFGAEDSHLLVASRKVRFDPSTPAACAQDDLRFSPTQ